MIESGDADNLVFAFFDRSVRNMKVQLEIIERIEAVKDANLFVLDHGQLTNVNAVGRYMNNVMGSTNQFYADITGEKVTGALLEALALGRYLTPHVPPGYVKGPDKVLRVDTPLVPIIRRAFELRAGPPAASWAVVKAYLAEHGITRGEAGVRAMLLNRVYLGELHFGDHENLTAHPPIIDPDLFELVGRTCTTGGRPAKSPHLLARLGVLYCGTCGSAMIVNTSANHYRCQGSNRMPCPRPVTARIALIEEWVMDRVREYTTQVRETVSESDLAIAADERLEIAQSALDNAIRAFTGMETEPAAVTRIAELREARNAARAERGALKSPRRKVVKPGDIDKLPEPERLAEWRSLITNTGLRVTVHPATRGRVWDADRFTFEFE